MQRSGSARFLALSVLILTGFALSLRGQPGNRMFRADMDGYHETPATLSSPANGDFEARLKGNDTIEYTLSYSGFTTAVSASHIHLGRPGTVGGVIAFLCGGGGKPACPQGSGTVTGTIVAADVVGPTAQGIAAGEFDELLDAMRAGATYVNVHTTAYPGGEILGPIEPRGRGFARGPK